MANIKPSYDNKPAKQKLFIAVCLNFGAAAFRPIE